MGADRRFPISFVDRNLKFFNGVFHLTFFLCPFIYYYYIVRLKHSLRSLTVFGATDPATYIPLTHQQLTEQLYYTDILDLPTNNLTPFLCVLVATGSQLMLCGLVFFFGSPFTDDTMNGSIVERLIFVYVWTSPVSVFVALLLDNQLFEGSFLFSGLPVFSASSVSRLLGANLMEAVLCICLIWDLLFSYSTVRIV
jgi:hypothetical protein